MLEHVNIVTSKSVGSSRLYVCVVLVSIAMGMQMNESGQKTYLTCIHTPIHRHFYISNHFIHFTSCEPINMKQHFEQNSNIPYIKTGTCTCIQFDMMFVISHYKTV